MSVTLDEAKNYLRVVGSDNDDRIDQMIDRAIHEVEDYIDANIENLTSSSSDGLSRAVNMAILILVERQWSTPPEKREMMTKAAHAVLDPHRTWLMQ